MNKKTIFSASWIIVVVTCFSVCSIGIPAVTTVGMGSRSYALGNNYVALSNDASAMFFNPGGLAFIPIREFTVAFTGIARTAETSFQGAVTSEAQIDKERLRLGSISIVRSFPTTQGGLAVAFGYQTPYILDDVTSYTERSFSNSGVLMESTNDYSAYGQFNLWTGSMGIQIAPNLSVGGALSLVTGMSSLTKQYLYRENGIVIGPDTNDYEVKIRQQYTGYDIRVGAMYSLPGVFSAGIRVVVPAQIGFDEEWDILTSFSTNNPDYANFSTQGKLETTTTGALGFAYIFPFMKATVEARARAPHPDALEHTDLSHWKAGGGVGIEVPLPIASTMLLRAGYSWNQFDQYPLYARYEDEGDLQAEIPFTVDDGEHLVSTGLAYLTSTGISFELAYAYRFWNSSMWEPAMNGTLHERHGMHRALASVSIRY